MDIGVIGAGGWGIALAKLLADKGERITLWCHGTDTCRDLGEKRESSSYLPGVKLPAQVRVTTELVEAVSGKPMLVCAVPSHALRAVMAQAASWVDPETTIVCGTKGLEEESLKTAGELLADIFGAGRAGRHAFLSGPASPPRWRAGCRRR
jgi:glycerol-3-phosphate dehydrogenase (NAD(P)+)